MTHSLTLSEAIQNGILVHILSKENLSPKYVHIPLPEEFAPYRFFSRPNYTKLSGEIGIGHTTGPTFPSRGK